VRTGSLGLRRRKHLQNNTEGVAIVEAKGLQIIAKECLGNLKVFLLTGKGESERPKT